MAKQPFMNVVKVNNPDSNEFDLSYDNKTSMKMGYLYPSQPVECAPGDKFRLSAQSLVRFAPMTAPVMHRFDIRHEYFFVPMRLLWNNFDKWITQTTVAGVLPAVPYIDYSQYAAGLFPLCGYMGLPLGDGVSATPLEKISALPFAAYQLIYNEYYRDQNLITEVLPDNIPMSDGIQNSIFTTGLGLLRKRAWEHDYFTSCLPYAQKGDPVMIPIGSQTVILDPTLGGTQLVKASATHAGTIGGALGGQAPLGELATGGINQVIDPNGTLITQDAGEATSINDLRLAYALQRLKEKLMRGGSRLTEFLRVVFGVTPQDARLQRPEYITGVKAPVVISEVLNTSDTAEAPQGNMSGHGVGVVDGGYGSYYCQEHGFIMCMTSVIPRTAYQQGINRLWSKIDDPTELITPDMAHIGEQTVRNKEIYAFQGAASEEDFGYMPRYSEYRQNQNIVTGEFRTTLKHWHDGRIFATAPALNEQFVECTPDSRIFAIEDASIVDQIYAHIYHDIKVTRKLPKFGEPTY